MIRHNSKSVRVADWLDTVQDGCILYRMTALRIGASRHRARPLPVAITISLFNFVEFVMNPYSSLTWSSVKAKMICEIGGRKINLHDAVSLHTHRFFPEKRGAICSLFMVGQNRLKPLYLNAWRPALEASLLNPVFLPRLFAKSFQLRISLEFY